MQSDDGNLVTICTLKSGQSFGELALVEKGGKRAATIMTTSDVECLTVDGEQYRTHLARIHQEELSRKVNKFMEMAVSEVLHRAFKEESATNTILLLS